MTKKQILEASRDGSLYITREGFFINDINVTKQMDKLAKLKFSDFESYNLPYIWSAYVQGFQFADMYLCSVPNYSLPRGRWDC